MQEVNQNEGHPKSVGVLGRDAKKEKHWRELVQKHNTCQMSVRQFCIAEKVNENNFYAWRKDWFASYITTLIERDVRDLRNIEQLTVMPKLLRLLASRAGGLLNYSDLSRSLGINVSTLKNYLSLFELLFILVPIQPWFGNKGKRLVKSPKMHLNDSGLLCYLLDCDATALANNGSLLGMVFENFVVMELMKQISWSAIRPRLYHFRTESGHEVDIVLESGDGRIVGIECKSGLRLSSDTFKGLKALQELTGKKFHRGIVLYSGTEVLTFEKEFQAVPVSALWGISSGTAPKLSRQ